MVDNVGTVKISEAVTDDVFGIHTVFYRTWLGTYPNEEAGITIDDVEDRFKDSFTEEALERGRDGIVNMPKEKTLLVAKDGTAVVGVCRIVRRSDKNQLQAIYILPEYQGKGLGKRFWEEAQKFFDASKNVVVEVATYNTKAIAFYTKLGFADTGRRFSDERFIMKSGARIPEMEMELVKNS